jgi:GxxExxY protein
MNENEVAKEVVDAALKVHKALGPGLLESAYEKALAHEMRKRKFSVEVQKEVDVTYDGEDLGCGFRADLIINGLVLVELKSVEEIARIHKKQTLTYLRLTGIRLGLLINFNEVLIKNGITRIVNSLPD